MNSLVSRPAVARTLLPLLALTALVVAGCDTYYIPPPPVSITLSSFTTSLVITTENSAGQLVPSTLQLQGAVANSPDPAIIYSVGQLGNYVVGGNGLLGYINSSGVYTAPTVVPNPNVVTILAQAHVDPTQRAFTTLTLENPTATTTSVSPNVVTQGETVTFDIVGTNYAQGATVSLSGAAQVNPPQVVSDTEVKLTAQIQNAGLLSLGVVNPEPFGATNYIAIRSQPASPASASAVAVEIGRAGNDTNGNPVTATKAYIPQPESVAIVNLDANKQIGAISMPTGFTPSMVAADPAHQQVVVAGTASNLVQVVAADLEQIAETYPVPVATTTTVDGGTCTICGMLVDSPREEAILSTAAGYIVLNLTDGSTSAPIVAPPSNAFSYDPSTQRVYVPFHDSNSSGVDEIDLTTGTVLPVIPTGGVLFGTASDSAAFDPGTDLVTIGDAVSGNYTSLNLNNALRTASAVSPPATPFSISAGCLGAWNTMDLDFTGHLGWFANLGGCVAVASLAPGAGTGAPGRPTSIRWAQLPIGPDGIVWKNTPLGSPHTLAVYTGADGYAYGLAVRDDDALLVKMNLTELQQAAPVPGGTDVNQVDPTQGTANGVTVPAFTYIALH